MGERKGGVRGRRVGRIFAYHQSRERECNEERMCMCVYWLMCVLGLMLMWLECVK